MAEQEQKKSGFGVGGGRGGGRALKNLPPIPEKGFVRKAQILREFPVSSSYWDFGVRGGFFPQPVKVGGSNLWQAEDIHALMDRARRGELAEVKGRRGKRVAA